MRFIVGVIKFWLVLVALVLVTLVVGTFAGAMGAYVTLGLLLVAQILSVVRRLQQHRPPAFSQSLTRSRE